MNELEQATLSFLTSEKKKTLKQIARLNDKKFLKRRKKNTRINYLLKFDLKVEKKANGEYAYVYSDTHLYDTSLNVFREFAFEKGLKKSAGFAIARKKRKSGVTDTKNVMVDDRKKLFKNVEKFIDKTAIQTMLKLFENQAKGGKNG